MLAWCLNCRVDSILYGKIVVLSGSAVPLLSMTKVQLCHIKTEVGGFLFSERAVGMAGGALAALWAQVIVGKGRVGLCVLGSVVVAGGCWLGKH